MIPKKIWLAVYTLLLVSCSLLPVLPMAEQNDVTPTLTASIATSAPISTETPLPTLTSTPTNLPEPTATYTPAPTKTPVPSPTATVFTPKYVLQEGSPAYQRGWMHDSLDCSWMGVAGQIFGPKDQPVTDMVVVVTGELAGQPLDLLGVAGAETGYGPGGYEVELAGQPLGSSGALAVRLYGMDGNPQSEPVTFDTYADCEKNLVVINWVTR